MKCSSSGKVSLFGVLAFLLVIPSAAWTKAPAAKSPYSETMIRSDETALKDVSDREYFIKLRELIAESRTQLDLCLSALDIHEGEGDSVKIILDDLMSAQKRGVKVRIFLNTFSNNEQDGSLFLRVDKLAELKQAGIEVHFIQPQYEVDDQVVISDEFYVLEGGPQWTQAALTEGLGSATLVESPSLARKKRTRLELLPLWDFKMKTEAHVGGELPIPLYLLQDVQYFPNMVSTEDGDALRIYLALLENYFQSKSRVLKVSLQDLGSRIPGENSMNAALVVHQVYEALTRLERSYELIQAKKEEPDQMEIELKLPEKLEPSVRVPLAYFHENYVKDLSPRASYAYFIMVYRLQTSGRSPVWVGSDVNVEQDFPFTKENFRLAVKELRRANLVEIFPFSLRQGAGYLGPDSLGYRYLINEIPTLSERLEIWSRLRETFGDDEFHRAKLMAELLGEPEDPKVITAYIKLMTQYPRQDIESLTQHLNTLPPTSTPNLLNYLKELLKNEIQQSTGLSPS